MKVVKSDSGFNSYKKIFKQVEASQSIMVIWQIIPESGERRIFDGQFFSLNFESGLIGLSIEPERTITSSLPVYCYSEYEKFIFKTNIHSQSKLFIIRMPNEIQLLDEPDVVKIKSISTYWKTKRTIIPHEVPKDYMVIKSMKDRSFRDQEFLNNELNLTLDEEDKKFAQKRETPRARPKISKSVRVKAQESDDIHLLKLFDLSRGGIGFITMDTHWFTNGSQIKVIGFEDFDLDDPLVATVMSQRPVDNTLIEFKIGCKFNEGQD